MSDELISGANAVALTRAVREADEGFQKSGGSSRHWVSDWFIPCLAKEGLRVVRKEYLNHLEHLAQLRYTHEPKP